MSDDDETKESTEVTPAADASDDDRAERAKGDGVSVPSWLAAALVVVLGLAIGAAGFALGRVTDGGDEFDGGRPIVSLSPGGGARTGGPGEVPAFPGGPGGEQDGRGFPGGPGGGGPGGDLFPGGPGGQGGGTRQGDDDSERRRDDGDTDQEDDSDSGADEGAEGAGVFGA